MNTDVYHKLVKIHKKWKEKIFGQICQDLLALSFAEMGCNPASIEVHNIEGVDIVIDDTNFGKYAIEVKTTCGETINLGEKDYKGLTKYSENGYETILAVLKIDLQKKWILANVSRKAQKYNLKVNELYTAKKYEELAKSVNGNFENLVKENYNGILESGENYLRKKLKEKEIKYSGK
jgi:Holliday junction resolvase